MGFSLAFYAFRDGDRTRLADFFARQGLHIEDGSLMTAAGLPLTFDGEPTDLTIDGWDNDEPLSGGIEHATLTESESCFLFDLCVAAGWAIVNSQGAPTFLIPAHNHTAADISADEEDPPVAIDDAAGLCAALADSFSAFRQCLTTILHNP